MAKQVQQLDRVIIRFAGDSGDGMQLAGDRFTQETAAFGNDISTLPDFPAEIRAPAGSLPGVSGFQLHFADHDILTPGDAPNVLVAMNPAALKTNIADLPRGGTLIVDADEFEKLLSDRRVMTVAPGEDQSRVVLDTANKLDAVIVSNNTYIDYYEEFPWIELKRISVAIMNGKAFLLDNRMKRAG